MKCELAEKVVILTDSIEILEFADKIGAPAISTSPNCQSGTERIIEAFEEINADFVVNVQGDEPFISPKLVDSIIEVGKNSNVELVTAISKITDEQALINPNIVKVLRDNEGAGIYFSRTPLPYIRGEANPAEWLKRCDYWRHIGIYGYSAKSLARYASLPVSKMEKCEMLEQLRFIASGYKFELVETDYTSIGIDTPEDLAEAEEFLKKI
jgi:3-deoxy-manno-octulosonate cytidylyltransferase (CMP-KDO synthetase)